MRKIKKYGWIPDLPDHRDIVYQAKKETIASLLPSNVDLRSKCPVVYDQGNLGSCTANAIGAAFEFELMKQNANFMPSRLFIYYNERVIENTVKSDSGAQIRDGIKSINKQGCCPETEWPYLISKFATKPTTKCYTDALKDVVSQYQSVTQTLPQIQACLVEGCPVIIGFTVYDSFESAQVAKTGIVNLPAKNESVLGGHAVLIVGYDVPSQRFIVRNSWGLSWGMKGYFTIPFAYFTNSNLSSDLWMLIKI